MTNKGMEMLNRRTRIRRAMWRGEPIAAIATREEVGTKYLYVLAKGWLIPIRRGIPQCFAPWGLQ